MNDVQQRLKDLQDRGWTVAAVADEIGLTVSAVEKWKAGDRYPGNSKLALMGLDGLLRRKRVPKQRRYGPESRKRNVGTS